MLTRPAPPQGWDTSDEHELELRRWRRRTEIVAVEALEPDHVIFGAFHARSDSGRDYLAEIRSLEGFDNACGCIDHRVNGLGTCKHIDGVFAGLRRRGERAFRQAAGVGSPRVEVLVRRHGDPAPVLTRPRAPGPDHEAMRVWLAAYLDADGNLLTSLDNIAALVHAYANAAADVKKHLRVSRHFDVWIERHRRIRSRESERAAFHAEGNADPGAFDLLRHPLLPYQRDGMMHLAFGERALLADEMGLGKTIQADQGGATRLLAVLDLEPDALAAEGERLARRPDAAALPIEVVDGATWPPRD